MSVANTGRVSGSSTPLTLAAYVSFVPIGIVTVLLGPMLPVLSARWSLNYAQAGVLFPVQYVASTVAVALSGVLVSRLGFRFAIRTGLFLVAVGMSLLMFGPQWMAILCIAAYGGGVGLAVPAANLMVAEVNPDRRSATLSWLNFCWSVGAVACPFLVAAAVKSDHIHLFLAFVSASSLLVALTFFVLPAPLKETVSADDRTMNIMPVIRRQSQVFWILGALFFLYVGMENGFGFWLASFSKSLGSMTAAMALMTPSFFYAALTLGRFCAPFLLRTIDEIRLVQAGLVLACAGMAGLVFSHGLTGVATSACVAGLGLSGVYPITIALLSKEFGAASSRIGSIMFVLSNIGGGLFPWVVGVTSTQFGSLKAGLFVPLVGCAVMFVFYARKWTQPGSAQLQEE
jgi:MFS transporter, FHS family, glucose/mannose:H+ symporter